MEFFGFNDKPNLLHPYGIFAFIFILFWDFDFDLCLFTPRKSNTG